MARARDFARRIKEKRGDWPILFERVVAEQIPTLGDVDIGVSFPICLFAGPNGVGKTTLLRAIWAAISEADIELTGPLSLKLTAGAMKVSYLHEGEAHTLQAEFGVGTLRKSGSLPCRVVHLDAGDVVRTHQAFFCEFESVEDIINGVGPRVADNRRLLEINYVTKRDYREVRCFEIEADGATIPFFEVAYGDDRYDSRTMGAGELAALFLWWAIDRETEPTVFLIEEPETYLSPACQEGLCHFFLANACEDRHSFLITSHSAKTLAALPVETHVYLYRHAGGVAHVEGLPPQGVLTSMGIAPAIDTQLLVEDELAKILLRLSLERFNSALSRRCDITVCDGHGGVTSILKKVAGKFSSARFLGVYDGDARAEVAAELKEFSFYLPGDVPLEVELRRMVLAETQDVERVVGINDLKVRLASLEGLDHHDWYAGLCEAVGLQRSQFLPMLLNIWLRTDKNCNSARALVDEIARTAS